MKNRSFFYLIAFAGLILAVGLACSALSGTPTSVPVSNPPTQQSLSPTSDNSTTSAGTSTGGDLITFTDQNKYYQIDLPGDWKYSQTLDKTSNNYYIDSFKSPDENALIENIAYDDGTAFVGSENGRFALYLLNNFYSSTGKEGDIKVTNDSIQKDGSERLTWNSKSGGYSGISYFEVRNKTTFLMFTVDWNNNYQSTYNDTLNNVISSYRLP
jgi:hypothetical protein